MSTTTVVTRYGKPIQLISEHDLCDPIAQGERIRAYCHLHRGENQRSLSINAQTGWGYCFNAACQQTVLVEEFNQDAAERLRRRYHASPSSAPQPQPPVQSRPIVAHPTRVAPPPTPLPVWQQAEVNALRACEPAMQQALARSAKAQAYLEARGVSLATAQEAGVCYLSEAQREVSNYPQLLRRWTDRLLFPLASPQGRGYIGRSLMGWKRGMDENQHKALLDQPNAPKRWIKTNPAGWFGSIPSALASNVILVEGGFDRLALLEAGFHPAMVLALAGTTVNTEWLARASQVKSVVLAFDADTAGTQAMERLAETLRRAGCVVGQCSPPDDGWGKDWSERYRRIGTQSVWPLYHANARVAAVLHSPD